ncbi:MAG: hypothetical protein ACT4SY_03420 [Hyphomicrobiales bacterium]
MTGIKAARPSAAFDAVKGVAAMTQDVNPGFMYCPTVKYPVSLDQTEGKCRGKHDCGPGACPLEHEFRDDRFARSLAALSAGIGSLWTTPKGRRP